MKKYLVFIIITFIVTSCGKPINYEWKHLKNIPLGDIAPIGLALEGNNIWLSDGDNNRLVLIDKTGKILGQEKDFSRPMHIVEQEGKIYIPEYGRDTITIMDNGKRTILTIIDSLDAPSGIDIQNDNYAIADFYNHRVVLKDRIIGGKGSIDGQFHYPTDVQFFGEDIWVADAYNHRVQVFDKEGNLLKIHGQEDGMNAVTGIFVTKDLFVVTDFENNRVLTYDKTGDLKNIINEHLEKPTDILVEGNTLYVINYKGKSLSVFER